MLQTAADYISSGTYVATKDSVIQKGIVLKRIAVNKAG